MFTETGPLLVDTRIVSCEPFNCSTRWSEAGFVQAFRQKSAPQASGALPDVSTRIPERNASGTLRLIGEGRGPVAQIEAVLAARDRAAAGPTAPACGLYLTRVDH